MKILYKTIGLSLLVGCFCLLLTGPTIAKVCFVGEPNCSGGGSFENYKDPGEDGKLCENEGYVFKDQCTDQSKYVVGYCPYNNNYVMCCGKDYAYDLCSYPLVSDGKCGSKHKCVCDAQFPFNDKYEETSCKNKYPGAIADGGSCVQSGYDANSGGSITKIYFSDCVCNPAIYRYVKEDCINGTEPSDDGCTGTDGISRYGSCICNREKYEFAAGDCEFGGNIDKKEYYCIQGGAYYFDRCYECDSYPATTLDHVWGGEGVGYEKCTYGKRYKILQCEKGYRPGRDGGNCRELTCEEAVDEWLDTYPAKRDRYTLVASAGNIKESKLKHATSNPAYIKTKNVILGADQKLTHIYAGINYYGASAFGAIEGGYMKERCKTRPTIIYQPPSNQNGFFIPRHSPFNKGSYDKGSVNLYGLKLDMSHINNAFSTTYGINAYNVDIIAKNWIIPANVDYEPRFVYAAKYDNEGYEAMPAINIKGTLKIQSPVIFDGMSFNQEDAYAGRGKIDIEVSPSYKGKKMATFRFKEDQEFSVDSVYMYPSQNDLYTDYNSKIQFIGPASENPSKVYTNLVLGVNDFSGGFRGASNMIAEISGHLIWNLYNKSNHYYITLARGSKIYSADFGSGEYAKIKRGTDAFWSSCSAVSAQQTPHAARYVPKCKYKLYCDRYKDEFYVVCRVNHTGISKFYARRWYVGGSNYKDGWCSLPNPPKIQFTNDCIIRSDCGDQHIINCN